MVCLLGASWTTQAQLQTTAGVQYLQCMPKDQSGDFSDLSNTYFLADSLASFDAAKGEGLDIAKQLRQHKIPSDVIHFDTGWFGVDWQCDYEFAKDRFKDPKGMLDQLKRDGSLIPHAPLAQRTDQIQWDKVEMKAYKADAKKCSGLLYKPGDSKIQQITQ